jgi:predicted RNA-binding Zn ribbon-like protein
VDIEEGWEKLSTPESLRDWLVEHNLLPSETQLDDMALGRALDLRETLRALLLANNEGAVDSQALATLNRVAGHACLVVQFGLDGQARLEPGAEGIDGALGRLLAIVVAAMIEGNWARLKACRNDICRWAFYDASKNQRGAWCSMAICGSRIKARAYRSRQRGDLA